MPIATKNDDVPPKWTRWQERHYDIHEEACLDCLLSGHPAVSADDVTAQPVRLERWETACNRIMEGRDR